MAMTKVLIIDSQTLFREALGVLLTAHGDCSVVGEANSVEAGVRIMLDQRPDVVVTELCLPDYCGADVVTRILSAQSDARVLALTTMDDEDTIASVVAAGAQGYLLKNRHADELVQTICTVSHGGAALDPLATPIIWRRFQQLVCHKEPGRIERLLPLERDVLELLVGGKSTRQIAKVLSTSPAVVERALVDVCEKLSARNRTQAAVIALNRRLVSAH